MTKAVECVLYMCVHNKVWAYAVLMKKNKKMIHSTVNLRSNVRTLGSTDLNVL